MTCTVLPFVSALLAWATLFCAVQLVRRHKDLLPAYVGVLTQPFRLDLQLDFFARHGIFVALTASLPVQVLMFFAASAPACAV